MEKKYQVFLSSTYEDLIEERKEVVQGILECNGIPAGMELFPASSKSQWEVIKRVIDDSDYYLLIIAGRYGSEGKDEDGHQVSYTEMEFDYAFKTGKPIITLIHKDPGKIASKYSESSQRKRVKLQKFKDKAMAGRLVNFWDNKDNLKTAVVRSLSQAFITEPATGWVKYGSDIQPERKVETIPFRIDSLGDAVKVVECLAAHNIAYINFEGVDYGCMQRILDIISGAQMALNGSIQKVSHYGYLAFPNGASGQWGHAAPELNRSGITGR